MPSPSPTEFDARARKLHPWFCRLTDQQIKLEMHVLTRWVDWLAGGHNGEELAIVLKFIQLEIQQGKRKRTAYALESILDLRTFRADLAQAKVVMQIDDGTPAAEAQPVASEAAAPVPTADDARAASERALTHLREFRKSL